jgi:hypothetical protein
MSASAGCPPSANHVGSSQSIATLSKGSLISVNNADLPGGVAECQVFIVESTVGYAGTSTYAWMGTGTPTVTAVPGLSQFGVAESTTPVTPANWLTTVVSLPSNAGCVGVETEDLLSFEYTPTALDIAAGGVTLILQYTGTAVGGVGNVNGGATITVVINSCDDGNPCTIDTCVPDLTALATCSNVPVSCPDDGNVCNGPEHCDPVTGQCVSGPALVCPDDGNVCNGPEHCDPILGCVSGPPLECPDDGNVCNGPEHCVPGQGCVSGPPLSCPDDGNVCNGPEHCDPILGCVSGPPLNCPDDGNVCNGPENRLDS